VLPLPVLYITLEILSMLEVLNGKESWFIVEETDQSKLRDLLRDQRHFMEVLCLLCLYSPKSTEVVYVSNDLEGPVQIRMLGHLNFGFNTSQAVMILGKSLSLY